MMPPLHVFRFRQGDILVARDLDDAWAVLSELVGLDREDYDIAGDMLQMDDDALLTPSERFVSVEKTMTCREWAARGRGLIWATE